MCLEFGFGRAPRRVGEGCKVQHGMERRLYGLFAAQKQRRERGGGPPQQCIGEGLPKAREGFFSSRPAWWGHPPTRPLSLREGANKPWSQQRYQHRAAPARGRVAALRAGFMWTGKMFIG